MDFEKEIESDLLFLIKDKDERTEDNKKHKKIIKSAKSNLKKMVWDRLSGNVADC